MICAAPEFLGVRLINRKIAGTIAKVLEVSVKNRSAIALELEVS